MHGFSRERGGGFLGIRVPPSFCSFMIFQPLSMVMVLIGVLCSMEIILQ